MAQATEVRKLALTHHDPMREDADVDQIEANAPALRAGIFAAREGMSLAV